MAATIFGFAGFAGRRLVAQNVTDATSNTLYTRRGQADSPWYLVGRDVMRGPLWAIHATYESRVPECVSLSPRCPRFHAETKPLLGRYPPQQWWKGGYTAAHSKSWRPS